MHKQIERLKYMDYLIRIESTGSMKDFARKLEISRSTCGEYIRFMRELGAQIIYCPYRKSYKYEKSGRLVIGFLD